jgi:hypothetical protein
MTFKHNFCESKIFGKPEYLNSITSIFISIIPLFFPFPEIPAFKRITILLILNGLSSFYYHYNLDWIGKQFDELTMILIVYIFLLKLIVVAQKINLLYLIDILFVLIFVINSIPKMDFIFPALFTTPIIILLYLIYKLSKIYITIDFKNFIFCLIGAFCWIGSELLCTKYTYVGHGLWHLFFSLGTVRLINNLDFVLTRNREMNIYII